MAGFNRPLKQRSLRDLSVLRLLSSITLLSSFVSAYQPVYFDSPVIAPQIPLAEPPSLSGTHEFVSLTFFISGPFCLSLYEPFRPIGNFALISQLSRLSATSSTEEPNIPMSIRGLTSNQIPVFEKSQRMGLKLRPALIYPSLSRRIRSLSNDLRIDASRLLRDI